jgi:regulator of protease activity HflC (stomatin/prohibitin superfamily)
VDFPSQAIITRDNVQLFVHPMLLYRIADPGKTIALTFKAL